MIFVDSNIPMYLVGGQHPHKADARRIVESLITDKKRLVTSSEVLQEILHRYRALDRRDAIQPATDALLGIVDEVFPVDAGDVAEAKTILLANWGLSSRDAVHAAVMQRRKVSEILSFDRGFDLVRGLVRIG